MRTHESGGRVVRSSHKKVHIAEKLINKCIRGVIVNIGWGAHLLDFAVIHDGHPVGNLKGFFLIMGDKDAGHIKFVMKPAQPASEFFADFGVKGSEGLVEKKDARLDGQRTRESHALPLASRKLVGIAIPQPIKLNQIEQFPDALTDLLFRRTRGFGTKAETEGYVFENRQMPEKGIVLKYKADLTIARRRVRGVLVVQTNRAAVGQFQAGNDAEERGLAGSGGAEQRHQFAGLDFKTDVGEGFIGTEVFPDVFNLDAHCDTRPVFRSRNFFAASAMTATTLSSEATANAPE